MAEFGYATSHFASPSYRESTHIWITTVRSEPGSGEATVRWCESGNTVNGPVAEVVGHARHRRHDAGARQLGLDGGRQPGRPEEPPFHGKGKDLPVELVKADAGLVGAAERAEGRLTARHPGIGALLYIESVVARLWMSIG